jgi:outer membrane protein TolC
MNKIIITIVLASSLSFSGYSQSSTSELKVSLQEAIDLGLKNRYDIQSDRYNLEIAENEIAKSKKEWVPEITGVGNIRYSPQIQATFIPGGFLNNEAALVALGAKSTTALGLDLNQTVYKPGISSDVKIAKNQLESEKQRNKQNENTIKEQIAQAYLNVVLKELQSKIAGDDEQRYKDYAQVAEGKMKIGSLIENDYLKAKLDYENAKVETLKAKQNYQLALDNIKYQINVPAETHLVLADSLNSADLLLEQLPSNADVANRTEIAQLILQQENNKLHITKNRQNALPSVSLYANYSKQFLYTNFNYSLGEWWSPYSYVGLRLNVPITSNFKNRHSIREYEIKTIQTDLTLKQKQADIGFEVQKASSELANAFKNMNTTKKNYDLSRVIYNNQKQQYDLGSLLYSSLLDTDRSLTITQQNYVKAVYDYLVAMINYQKALGTY